jgi:hypothetical protein
MYRLLNKRYRLIVKEGTRMQVIERPVHLTNKRITIDAFITK